MGLSSAVHWWEDSQLRILALGSLGVQCYLALFASARKKHIWPLFRFSIWLAYLGGDALAIYALATLFNRKRKVQHIISVNGSHDHDLEVLWAPILLTHLGGQVNISAYNIEDNELWRRHLLTAVAQVTVALYVFSTSWSSSADKRLLVAAALLFVIGFYKCFAKPIALKRSSFSTIVTTFRPVPRSKTRNREIELEEYIQKARDISQVDKPPYVGWGKLSKPDRLFVDYEYVYRERLTNMTSFWFLDKGYVYKALRVGLSKTFDLIYSKIEQWKDENRAPPVCSNICSGYLSLLNLLFPIMPIGFFHASHKVDYSRSDIIVTFLLLYITYILEIVSLFTIMHFIGAWSDGVAQHNLIGLLACNRRHKTLMGIAEFLRFRSFASQLLCGLKPCHSSKDITMLVHKHVKAGWLSCITDIESYWRFSDNRGQWAVGRNGCEELLWSIEKPFDESIIVWHVATDFCLYYSEGTSPDPECSRMCREISNYMMHLLFANPEMLLPGSRRNLFTDAYHELELILHGDDDPSLMSERGLPQRIINKVGLVDGFIQDSNTLRLQLKQLGDEKKMWEVIQGVWIEMLCFSAGRCRGYLHAKSLGSGGEYLTFVSLLMSHAGLETYAERQQRWQLRLPKYERVKIAKLRIQEDTRNKATGVLPIKTKAIGGSSTPKATSPLDSQVNGQGKPEDVASTSASRVQCVGPAPMIKITVSP